MTGKNLDPHDRIVEVLFELCHAHKGDSGKNVYSRIYADHIGKEYKPIILSGSMPRKPIAKWYYPDIWTQVREKEQFDIYEVWHTENEAQAVQDILFSSFVKGVRYFHIACTGENMTGNNAKELMYLILIRIHDEEGKRLLDPDNVYITEVPTNMQNDKLKTKAHLTKEFEFSV